MDDFERNSTIQALVLLNEEMCDYHVAFAKEFDNIKKQLNETSQSLSEPIGQI